MNSELTPEQLDRIAQDVEAVPTDDCLGEPPDTSDRDVNDFTDKVSEALGGLEEVTDEIGAGYSELVITALTEANRRSHSQRVAGFLGKIITGQFVRNKYGEVPTTKYGIRGLATLAVRAVTNLIRSRVSPN